MKQILPILLVTVCFALSLIAQTPQQYVVQVSTITQQDPSALLFSWPPDLTTEQYLIHKRNFGEKEWGTPDAILDGSAVSYTDTNVVPGILYEYGFFKKPAWIEDTIRIISGEPVTFTIYDSWGDGMCCWLGFGYYRITACNSILAEGGEFLTNQSVSFTVPGVPQDSTDIILHFYFDGYPDETTWTLSSNPIGTLLASGGPYEKPCFSYITSGIRCPAIEHRGKVLLLVDDEYSLPLRDEISRLVTDLIGDGWLIKRVDVNRDMTVVEIKETIQQNYSADTSIRTLFLLGHIPVPYSGEISMDGHPNHQGAWPADVFYGELNGEWTDVTVNNTLASRPANHNIPGDGKFDQIFIPSDMELEVGRVDLYDLPAFPENETELMRRYLEKNHAYRHGNVNVNKKGLINQYLLGSSHAIGWRNFPLFFTADSLVQEPYTDYLGEQSCLWSFGCSGSGYTNCGGIVSTVDFASETFLTVFTMLFGSYFGDWDNTDNVLRSPLASNGYILTNCWSCIPMWNIHPMAMGFTIGYCTKLTQNTFREYTADFGNRYIHTALMGDPTLRMHVVKPVPEFAAETAGNGVLLNWSVSPDDILGYLVYRSGYIYSDFIRVQDTLITGTSFFDNSPLAGKNIYMLRSMKLEQSGSGTYYNLSEGVLDSVSIQPAYSGIDEGVPFRVYPNPFRNEFIIEAEYWRGTWIEIRVMNVWGGIIYTKNHQSVNGDHRFTIYLPGLPAGVYFIRIFGDRCNCVRRVVKVY